MGVSVKDERESESKPLGYQGDMPAAAAAAAAGGGGGEFLMSRASAAITRKRM